jgi:PTS system cellobiose-specific IIC component
MLRSLVAWKPWSAASRAAPALARLGDAPFLVAIRDALPWAFGALLLGMSVLFFVVAAPAGMGGAAIARRISIALLPAFGIMSCALAVALPIALARRANYRLWPLVLSTLAAFALILPRPFGPAAVTYLQHVGAVGIFLAIVACGVVGAGVALARHSAGALVSLGLLALVTVGIGFDVSAEIARAIQPMGRLGDTLPALVAIVAAQMLLWLIGVHGTAVLAAVLTPVYLTLQMQNTAAFSQHLPLPHVVVTSLFLFIFPGGSGATMPLAVLFAFSRVPRLRRLGRVVLLPAMVNVNEPLLFGLPVVLNPYFVVPFFVAPLVLACITYGAIALGMVARPAFYVPTIVPAPISTYLATLDPRAVVLLVVNVLVATMIYAPFVRAYERKVLAQE